MYVSSELKGKESDDFTNYLTKVQSRMQISLPEPFSTGAVYNGNEVSLFGYIYHVEESFDSIKSFENSGRRPLDNEYEVDRRIIYEDGRVLVKGLIYLPLGRTDRKSRIEENKNIDIKLLAAYMFYPKIRKYAPEILFECISPEILGFETFSFVSSPLSSYAGLNQLRKILQRAYMRKEFQKQSQVQ